MSGTKIGFLVGGGLLVLIAILVAQVVLGWTSTNNAVNSNVPRTASVGECFATHTESFQPVSCSEPHHFEVYSLIEFSPGDPYPGALGRLAGSNICVDDFVAYTGKNYLLSDLDYSIPFPTETEWEAGDLVTVCALHHVALDELVGSQRSGLVSGS